MESCYDGLHPWCLKGFGCVDWDGGCCFPPLSLRGSVVGSSQGANPAQDPFEVLNLSRMLPALLKQGLLGLYAWRTTVA